MTTQRVESAPPPKISRAYHWTLGLGLLAMVLIGCALLFLLTQATTNRAMYERNYATLFALNVIVASALLLIILWIGYRLLLRLRQQKFGSRLLVKLAAVFAIAGFAPGVLIYVVSYQFVNRSIESWFDIKVESALESGLNLGRTALDALALDFAEKARTEALKIDDIPDVSIVLRLERLRESLDAEDVTLWDASGHLVALAGSSRYGLTPETPSSTQLRTARAQAVASWIDGLEDGSQNATIDARMKTLVRLKASGGNAGFGGFRYLLAAKALPTALVRNALQVTQVNREYQERALARQGLKRMYIGTLTLSLFMAVFGGVLLAVFMGNQLARPLLLLADGVREVAAGNLTPKASLRGKDELDGLTRSFAMMTQQLADARAAVQTSMQQVNAARANLQTILDNLTAGVIVLDEQGRVMSSNPGATRILRVPFASFHGQKLSQIHSLKGFGAGVETEFDNYLTRSAQRNFSHWQQSFTLGGDGHAGLAQAVDGAITLVARGAELPGHQRLLVFDDISEIVSAQRSQAWGEVARRLAHEIKNPLTPIQLSAERLERKLVASLNPTEQALLKKSVKTIVDQVDAMKRLVNEFRDYARLPAAELKPLDLNNLVQEVLNLYASDATQIPIQSELDAACPLISGDVQQIRQVLHNLLQNAQDATLSAGRAGLSGCVLLKTQSIPTAHIVRLSIEDCGTGFSDAMLKRIFEPYVTTKDKGTGLGLAVVKKILDEHRARIEIGNRIEAGVIVGAQVSLSFATDMPQPHGGVAS